MILVTGAAGLLGREMVRLLAGRGCPVRALDLVWTGEPALPGVERLAGDLLEPDTCRAALQGVRAVVHAAAVQLSTPGRPRFRVEPYFRRNTEMTRRLLEASSAAGVERFVFISSDMVYGPSAACPLREDAPTRPVGPYGRSKLATEVDCRAARGRIAHVTILRPGVIVGPGRLGLLKALFDRVRAHRALGIPGDGMNHHHMVAVSDVAEACRLALAGAGDGTYNVGSPDPPTVRALLAELCRRAGSRSRLVALPAWPTGMLLRLLWCVRLSPLCPEQFLIAPLDVVLDTSAARAGLGFVPRCHDADSLWAAYRWYLDTRSA